MKVKEIQGFLNCECPKKDTSFCNTKNCPIFEKFTNKLCIADYFNLGMNTIVFSFKIKEKK